MSSNEILESLSKTDKLVASKGFIWEIDLPSYEGFDYLCRLTKSMSKLLVNGEYDRWLLELLEGSDKGSESMILLNQKQLYFSIILNSSFSSKLCTDYYPDFVNRFVNSCKSGPLRIVLSDYDFIPFQYANDNTLFRTFQILLWRMEVLRRYNVVREFEKRFIYGGDILIHQKKKDDFYWCLQRKQLKDLLKELKRYFDRNSDLDQVCEILLYPYDSNGNIVWLGSTEALAYLFHKMFLSNYINNQYWASVISRNMLFISKRGTIITSQNLNTSLYRITCKKVNQISLSKELVRIDIGLEKLKLKKRLKYH